MRSTTAVMLQDRLNDIERNICDGIDFRQELNEAYALADELQAENDKLRELVSDLMPIVCDGCHERLCDMPKEEHPFVECLFDCRMRELGVEVER